MAAQQNQTIRPILNRNTQPGLIMNTSSIITLPEPSEAEIQHTAYLLWLENGQKPGHDLENWLAAKELLRHRHAPGKGARHRPASTIPPAVPVTEAAESTK
jgi:hypothetical protein